MKNIWLVPLILSACALFPTNTTYRDATDLALDATVHVRESNFNRNCGGVLHRGLVITAQHCVREAGEITFSLRQDPDLYISASVLAQDATHDVAIIRADDRVLSGGLELAEDPPGYGDPVVAIGHPLGLRWTLTNGIVSFPRRTGGPRENAVWIQVTAPATRGNSGGPLLNEHAQIVGIISFTVNGNTSMVGASHLETIRRLVNSVTHQEDE